MHSAVMQDKKYIEFANQNTVEVLALQRLDEAVKKQDKRAVAYKAKGPDGQEAVYMLQWPNLTLDEIVAFNRTKAGSYNQTGGIPYTAIVDPHTLTQIKGFSGGQTAKTLMDECAEAKKKLVKEHGKGITRKELQRFDEFEVECATLVTEKDYSKAIRALEKVAPKPDSLPELLQTRMTKARESIVSAAKSELEEIKGSAQNDPIAARRALQSLTSRIRGTGLEAEARNLMKEIVESAGN